MHADGIELHERQKMTAATVANRYQNQLNIESALTHQIKNK